MRVWMATSAAVVLASALAAPAQAGDLPPPSIRPSSAGPAPRPVRRARPHVPSPRTAVTREAVAPRPTRRAAELPYRLPYSPAQRAQKLPISGPSTARTTRTTTYVPPLPGNWVDARRTAPRRKTTQSAPVPRDTNRRRPARASVAALPAPTVRGKIAPAAPAPRRLATSTKARPRRAAGATAPRTRARTVVRRATPRRPVLRGRNLTVPCAPGQKAPAPPVRRSLHLVCPPGTCDT